MPFSSFAEQALPFVNLGGVFFGFLGSLFLTYDLLGRPGGFLRGLLATLLPALLSAIIFLGWTLISQRPLNALIHAIPLLSQNVGSIQIQGGLGGYLNEAAFGVIIGVLTGVCLSSRPKDDNQLSTKATTPIIASYPQATGQRYSPALLPTKTQDTQRFSWTNARRAASLSAVLLTFANVVYVVTGNSLQIADYVQFAVFVLAGFVIGGFSQSVVQRIFPRSGQQARIFSISGLVFGFVVSILLDLAFGYGYYVGYLLNYINQIDWSSALAYLWSLTVFVVFDALFDTAIPGALSGAFSRYIFWRANVMPERQLGAVGISLIIVAFLSQAYAPIAQLAGWLPR